MDIFTLLHSSGISPPLPSDEAQRITKKLGEISKTAIYPPSIVVKDGLLYFLSRKEGERLLGVLSFSRQKLVDFQEEESSVSAERKTLFLKLCPLVHANALALRRTLEFLQPRLVGLRTSVGLGDRLGLATPGHARAARDRGLAVFFVQQSIREMSASQPGSPSSLWSGYSPYRKDVSPYSRPHGKGNLRRRPVPAIWRPLEQWPYWSLNSSVRSPPSL